MKLALLAVIIGQIVLLYPENIGQEGEMFGDSKFLKFIDPTNA